MVRGSRSIGAMLAGCMLACSWPVHAEAAKSKPKSRSETPARAIVILINGEEIARDPAPRIVGGRLLVPVVRIYSALGIAVSREGDDIIAAAPAKKITLHIGSAEATIDNRTITMQGPATELGGATYVPLRFVADSLGAQVTYNAQAARVEVTSSIIGRTPGLTQNGPGGGSQVAGTVSAIDLNSAPESITVTRSGSVRTVAINSDAKILIQDVITKTNTPATLNDIHVGDAVSVFLSKEGKVRELVDRIASRAGTVAAVSPSAVVLQSGYVVTPDRNSEVTVNGAAARIGDLKVGDVVTVRSNPDTNEKRQIIASRPVPPTPQAAGSAAISSLTVAARGALKAGDSFEVTLKGTPGGKASFDIGAYVTNVAMREESGGTYTARYTIPPGVNFGQTPIYGHLSVNGQDAPRAQAPSLIAVSTTPPQIVEVAPPAGQTVNNSKPSIYATFVSPTDVAVNPSTVTIHVNGLDVTASATRTATFITYSPSVALGDGPVRVRVTITDNAGNTAAREWTFTVRTH